ncbi:hypothetical protein AB0H76_17865 [Nocardia sp. NPDC050712]
MLITVITDYNGVPDPAHRTQYLDDIDGALAAIRAFLLAFGAPAPDR